MTVKRAYKYRFYPTDEQAQNLAQTFGCVRFIYNDALLTVEPEVERAAAIAAVLLE